MFKLYDLAMMRVLSEAQTYSTAALPYMYEGSVLIKGIPVSVMHNPNCVEVSPKDKAHLFQFFRARGLVATFKKSGDIWLELCNLEGFTRLLNGCLDVFEFNACLSSDPADAGAVDQWHLISNTIITNEHYKQTRFDVVEAFEEIGVTLYGNPNSCILMPLMPISITLYSCSLELALTTIKKRTGNE